MELTADPVVTMGLFVPLTIIHFLIRLATPSPGEEENVIFRVTEEMIVGSNVVEEGSWMLVGMMIACV